jgi:hypothetical protein
MPALKVRENAFLWLLAASAVVALLAGISAGRESAGFFVAIRVVVCFASVYAAVKAYRAKRETWAWLLGANAALYNPFLLVHLTRDTWKLVDLADIALVVTAAVVLRVRGEKASVPIDDRQKSAAEFPGVQHYRTPSRTEIVLWSALLTLVLFGSFLIQFDKAQAGAAAAQNQAHPSNVGVATLGLAFWSYLTARVRRWRRPGRVALGSVLAGLIAVFAGSMAGGYVRGSEMNSEMSAILVQIGQFDPALAARLRAGPKSGGTPLAVMMKSSLTRALQEAPDDAVVTFARQRYDIIISDESVALKRCVAAFEGSGDFALNSREQLAMMRATGNLYSAAATRAQIPMGDDEQRAIFSRLAAVYKQVDPVGVLDDERKRSELTQQEQCDLYTRLMQTLWTLPTRDAATAIRAMSTT